MLNPKNTTHRPLSMASFHTSKAFGWLHLVWVIVFGLLVEIKSSESWIFFFLYQFVVDKSSYRISNIKSCSWALWLGTSNNVYKFFCQIVLACYLLYPTYIQNKFLLNLASVYILGCFHMTNHGKKCFCIQSMYLFFLLLLCLCATTSMDVCLFWAFLKKFWPSKHGIILNTINKLPQLTVIGNGHGGMYAAHWEW